MRRSILLVLALLTMLLLAGCGFILPDKPGIGDDADTEDDQDIDAEVDDKAVVAPEQSVEPEDEEEEEVVEPSLPISGSLYLQTDHSLCPHLVTNFSCNKYDLRDCGYTQLIGKEQFYPNVLNCRDGDSEGQVFCLIQECMPLTEENIVYAYGGTVAYAEYTYTKEKVSGGIMLHYNLFRCGEMGIEFETQDKCKFYRSKSGLP